MTNRDQMHLKSYLLIENALMSQKSYLLIIIDCSRSININTILRVLPRNSPKSNLEFQLHKHRERSHMTSAAEGGGRGFRNADGC